jgi:D-ribulokinase
MQTGFYLGIDVGTSGVRAIAINDTGQIQAQSSVSFVAAPPPDLAQYWQASLFDVIEQLPLQVRQQTQAIAINGTSSTVLICDDNGVPLDQPILYNDDRGASVLEDLRAIAPPNHTVLSATSSLAKLLWWAICFSSTPSSTPNPNPHTFVQTSHWDVSTGQPLPPNPHTFVQTSQWDVSTGHPLPSNIHFLHQADWLSFLLHGQLGISDYHNALKLGYDVGNLCYPDWMAQINHPFVLPTVVAPGTAIAPVTSTIAQQFALPSDCYVCAGTTDSIAAFLASGARIPGEAVSSLGSTLVLKLLSKTRVDDVRYGIYSHRLGNLWLVGGASNTGGAVLKQFFSADELTQLSQQIDPYQPSRLDYYPLLKPGERFPINDPNLEPRLQPRPDNPAEFLHGLLESIACIEAQGYRLLQELGATPLAQVYSAGGGAQNAVWMEMRSRHLQVPVSRSGQTEAAYGSALLARQGIMA